MENKGIDFPQYRKLSNNKVFYCIKNDREFEEIQIIGQSAQLHRIVAKQYPEMLRIQDLLNLSMEGYLTSTRDEYEQLLKHYALS